LPPSPPFRKSSGKTVNVELITKALAKGLDCRPRTSFVIGRIPSPHRRPSPVLLMATKASRRSAVAECCLSGLFSLLESEVRTVIPSVVPGQPQEEPGGSSEPLAKTEPTTALWQWMDHRKKHIRSSFNEALRATKSKFLKMIRILFQSHLVQSTG
jgi:hypothetical protein